MRGYFGIGIFHTKTEHNVGTLWRSAYQLGASFVFTIGRRYKEQSSDTYKTTRHTPLYHYRDFDHFQESRPHGAELIGVELSDKAETIPGFKHPQRAIYLLGAEDHGLPPQVMQKCQSIVALKGGSFNVAVAGSIIMYDRVSSKPKESPDV